MKPTPRGALAAVVIGGKTHTLGGIGWHDRNTPAHEIYDPAANGWTAALHGRTRAILLLIVAADYCFGR
jgi:hypothetical protein